MYFFISLLPMYTLIITIKCELTYHENIPKAISATEAVLAYLTRIPDDHVCVWHISSSSRSSNSSDAGDAEERLVKALFSSYKAVARFLVVQVDTAPSLCRHNALVTDGSRCRGLLAPSLPLTMDHHYYVLVAGRLAPGQLDLCYKQFGLSRAAFVSLLDGQVLSLSSPFFTPRSFINSELSSISITESVTSVNLKQTPVSIASFNCPPFVVIRDTNNPDSITGIEWEVVRCMAKLMNFTIKMAALKGDKKWGYLLNDSWTGGIALAMYEGDAEIGVCNMWYTLPTYQIMNFGHPLNEIRFTYIVPRPKPLLQNWGALVKVFDSRVWLLIVAAFFFCTVCYWSLLSSDHCPGSITRTDRGLVKVSLSVFGMLMGTWSPPQTAAAPNSTRLLVTWWSLFVVLLASTYNTSIASRLTLQGYEQRLDTIQQLVEHDLRWSDHPSHSRQRRSIYFNFANKWQKEWEKRYVYIPSESMKTTLDSGKFAFPIQRWGERLLFLSVVGLDMQQDLDSMRVLKETTTITFESIKFAKHSPLYQACQVALLRVTEAGLVRHWTSQASRAPSQHFARRLLQEEEGRADAKQLTLANLSLVFFMLIAGLIASTLVFTCEILCMRRKIC